MKVFYADVGGPLGSVLSAGSLCPCTSPHTVQAGTLDLWPTRAPRGRNQGTVTSYLGAWPKATSCLLGSGRGTRGPGPAHSSMLSPLDPGTALAWLMPSNKGRSSRGSSGRVGTQRNPGRAGVGGICSQMLSPKCYHPESHKPLMGRKQTQSHRRQPPGPDLTAALTSHRGRRIRRPQHLKVACSKQPCRPRLPGKAGPLSPTHSPKAKGCSGHQGSGDRHPAGCPALCTPGTIGLTSHCPPPCSDTPSPRVRVDERVGCKQGPRVPLATLGRRVQQWCGFLGASGGLGLS